MLLLKVQLLQQTNSVGGGGRKSCYFNENTIKVAKAFQER